VVYYCILYLFLYFHPRYNSYNTCLSEDSDNVSEAEEFLDHFEEMEAKSQRRREAKERTGHKGAAEQVLQLDHL
jgi:hypothetical protein